MEREGVLTYKLSSPECDLLETKLDMFGRVVWANVAPSISAIMLGTLEFLLDKAQLFCIRKISHSVPIGLLLYRLRRLGILDQSNQNEGGY